MLVHCEKLLLRFTSECLLCVCYYRIIPAWPVQLDNIVAALSNQSGSRCCGIGRLGYSGQHHRNKRGTVTLRCCWVFWWWQVFAQVSVLYKGEIKNIRYFLLCRKVVGKKRVHFSNCMSQWKQHFRERKEKEAREKPQIYIRKDFLSQRSCPIDLPSAACECRVMCKRAFFQLIPSTLVQRIGLGDE